jgi:hypothetical protein
MKRRFCALLLALLCATPARGAPAVRIGRIRTLEGTVAIHRDGTSLPGAVGGEIHRGDLIRTGKGGAVGIVLDDDTTISLGSGSELTMVDFAFVPKEGRFALVVRMAKGTFAYLAGLIGKLAPGKAQLQLPDATISMRGTKLLVQVGK